MPARSPAFSITRAHNRNGFVLRITTKRGQVSHCFWLRARAEAGAFGDWGFVLALPRERPRPTQVRADLDGLSPADAGPSRRELTRYALERRLLVRLRRNIHHNALGALVRRIRWACDVLLR